MSMEIWVHSWEKRSVLAEMLMISDILRRFFMNDDGKEFVQSASVFRCLNLSVVKNVYLC